MPPTSIGINLRVTGHCSQGGRKYMEDFFSVAYQQSQDEKDLEYAFFGIYDGHGGSEAATFAKEHLMNAIVSQKLFWSDYDQDVLRAIREGYIATHYAMWREQEKWPKTATGLPSTAGTTASVAFIRRGKIYIGHVGDSGIVLGYQEEGEKCWRSKPLTHDHKPECNVEKARIINSGGKVITKSGVPRVVWNRPRIGHKGPVRRSTPIDEIPFLAVARSLGDLWSYNSALNEFVVSPDPDVKVIKIDPKTYRCLIFGTDGLWNVLLPSDAVDAAHDAEIINERLSYLGGSTDWTNPSKCLVDKALERWDSRKMRADNTSVVTIMLDPPGPPKKSTLLRNCTTASYGLEYIQMGEMNDTIDRDYQNDFMQNYSPLHPPEENGVTMHNHHHHHHHHPSGSMIDSYSMSNNGYAIMTSYENEVSRDSSNSSTSSEGSGVNVRNEFHSYHSLDETGLAGHDHIQHHQATTISQQEQHMYQQQCMSAEEGYSLTKLETRGEQQYNSLQSYREQHNVSFQDFGEESSFNHYGNTASNYHHNITVSSERDYSPPYDDHTMMGEEPISTAQLLVNHRSELIDEVSRVYEPTLVLTEDKDKNWLEDKKLDSFTMDESIQINEISSSVIEPAVTSISKNDEDISESFNRKTEVSNIDNFDNYKCQNLEKDKAKTIKSTIIKHKPNRKCYSVEQNENISISERRQLRSSVDYTKRTLRSRNSLSKDLKAKAHHTHSLRRSNLPNQYQNACPKQRPRHLQQQQVTIWSPRQNRKTNATITNPTTATTTVTKQQTSQCSKIISKVDIKVKQPIISTKPKITTTIGSSNNSSSSSSSSKMQSLSGSCNAASLSVSSTTTMSKKSNASSRNSAWCPSKTVQTRNRVQKRLSH